MSPLNRVRIEILVVPTIFSTGCVLWMTWYFNVPWSYVHWWIFGFLWLGFAAGYAKGALQREILQSVSRETDSDVFRYIEREDRR